MAAGERAGDEAERTTVKAATDGADAREAGGTEKGGEAGEAGEGESGEAGAGGRVVLTEAGFATARIAVAPAERDVSPGDGAEVPGQVEFDPARVALISPRTGGRVERLLAVPGDRVRPGQTVALVLSPAFVTAQADFVQAKRRADLLAGTPDAEGARALLAAAERRLELLGVGRAAIARLEAGGEAATLLPVVAPFAGSIVEAPALAGQAVESGAPLYKIADLSAVNVAADVPERAIAALRVGQQATVRIAALPDGRFAGRVARVSDQLDAATRTVEALVRVANADRRLKPGMFATVVLHGAAVGGAGAAATGAVSVPASAVVSDGAARYVFVETGPRRYERRTVEVAASSGPTAVGGRVTVVSGLAPGERVVTRGAFTLKSELAKAEFAEDEG